MDYLRRRAAFWRNLEYDLDHMTESVSAKMADRWCDKEDLSAMDEIKTLLLNVLKRVRERQIEVLHEQITQEDF